MTNNDIALFSGLVVTLISAAVFLILEMTADYSPTERRARRLAILASVVVSAAILGATVAIYNFSELVGSFLVYPSIGLTAVAVWHASRFTYRALGGGNRSNGIPSEDAGT
jgi:heme A synthase